MWKMIEIIVFGAAFFGGIEWVFGPLHRAGRIRQCPVQFTLADLLCLFFMVSSSMGGIHTILLFLAHDRVAVPDALVYCLDCLAIVAAGLAWWHAVRTLSRARIHTPWQRLLVLGLAVPVAYCGPIVAVALFFVVPFGLSNFLSNPLFATGGFVGFVAIISAVFACGKFTRWCVASALRDEYQRESADDRQGPNI